MKWLFAHDNRFYQASDGSVFSEVAFQYEDFERYLEHTDELIVLARLEEAPKNAPLDKWNLSSGPKMHFVRVPDPYGIRSFTPFPKEYRKVKNEVAQVDVVIARLPSEIGYMAVDAARELNKPYAIEVVGDAYGAMHTYGNLKGKLYAPFAQHKMKKRVFQAKHVLYITERVLQEAYPTSGASISCSNVELQSVAQPDQIKERIEQVLRPKEYLEIGMNGSLSSAYKGFDIALKALAKAKPQIPPFRFTVVGKGDASKWEQLAVQLGIQNEVRFIGSIPHNKIFDWLKKMDLFLMPSRTEGQGRALIEALSCGCPAIGASVGGIKELLKSEQLHEVNNSEQLAQKIIEILNSPSCQMNDIEEAFETAKKFNIDELRQKRRQFYGTLNPKTTRSKK
ncbi:glycosyltransferase family 4 protein [Listeria aquatica]|uniref:glycosyltransferase family 4 protein n=1 Tax=Listeria aquatica TaxID=1494960 RepID=UPI003EF6C92E